MLLDGKSAIITGAGSGVGRAAALRFVEEGARVVCADIDFERVKETVALVEAAGGTATAFGCDVSQEADVIALIAAAVDANGRLDVMFNNVGIPTPRPGLKLEDHTVEDFDRLVNVNLRGTFLGCKHAVLQFKAQGGPGAIVNTGSVAGLVAFGGVPYGATKGGVHQLTRGVAIEGAPFGIRANTVAPAAMPTNFMAAGGSPLTEDEVAGMGAFHPLGKPIDPRDVANAALFLASDLASNVTGIVIPVDGGYVAR